MICNCKIELADYRHAMWLHVKPRKFLAVLGLLLLALLVILFLFILYIYISTGQHLAQLCAMVGVFAYFTFAVFWWRSRVRRTYAQTKLLHEPYTFETTDSHLVTKSGFGEGRIPWEAFHKWKADSRLVLVYQSDVMFHLFPRHAFPTAADFQTFLDLISSKVRAAR